MREPKIIAPDWSALNDNQLSQRIVDALGRITWERDKKRCDIPIDRRSQFAKAVIEGLRDEIKGRRFDVVPPDLVNDAEKLRETMLSAGRTIRAMEKKIGDDDLLRTILRVTSRYETKDTVDLNILERFSSKLAENLKHERFRNTRRGNDIRLSLAIAHLIAKKYTRYFHPEKPGIAGNSKVDSRATDNQKISTTRYQRVCNAVTDALKIQRIGKNIQTEAIKLNSKGYSDMKFFSVTVTGAKSE